MKSEKFAVYMILFFVIVIISVNIFGSLSMLRIDKRDDVQTYRSMGAEEALMRYIFVLQGWLISVIGTVAGIVLGLVLCFVQQYFKIITMPGNYIIDSYPIDVHFADVLITFFGVISIGYLIAVVPVKLFLKKS
jgi:lipoprotein-releasing system permease protein